MLEDGPGHAHLVGGVDLGVVGGHGDPRLAGGETGVRGRVPLHGGAGVVPGDAGQGRQDPGGVVADAGALVEVVDGLQVPVVLQAAEDRVRLAELLALVDVGRAPVQVEDRGQRLGADRPPGRVVVAEAGDGAGLIVVVPVGGVPAALDAVDRGQALLPAGEVLLEGDEGHGPRVELAAGPGVQAGVLELEDHVELGGVEVRVALGLGEGDVRGLADREDVAGAGREDGPPHLVEELVDARAVGDGGEAVAEQVAVALDAVDQRVGLGDEGDDVHAEAVDAAVEPAAHHGVHGAADVVVLPVEVGLLGGEQVEVELAGGLVPGPGGAGEGRAPVGGLGAGAAGLQAGHVAGRPPDVPVALGVVPAGAGGGEPGVLVARVVDHQVHDQAHAAPVQCGDELVEVGERPEERVDVLVVGDVVAVVVLRGAVDGAEPHDVDPEPVEVVEAGGDAGDVADAVAVGVLEGARVDLVDDGAAPPVGVVSDVAGAGDEGGAAHGRTFRCGADCGGTTAIVYYGEFHPGRPGRSGRRVRPVPRRDAAGRDGGAVRRGGTGSAPPRGSHFCDPRMTPEMTQRWAKT